MDVAHTTKKRSQRWTVDDVERALLARIASGRYPVGEQLPTCASLGDEFGVDKNVISKAYQRLTKEGIVNTRFRQGTSVLRRPTLKSSRQAQEQIRGLLSRAAQLAEASGVQLMRFIEEASAVAESVYEKRGARVAFVECNMVDGRSLGAELQAVLALPVRAVDIEEFIELVADDPNAFDLAVISLVHVTEVEDGLRTRGAVPTFPLETLFTLPTAESISVAARLPRSSRVGVVCATQSTLTAVSGLLAAANPLLKVSSVIATKTVECATLLKESNVVFATNSALPYIAEMQTSAEIVQVNFRIDQVDADRIVRHLRNHPGTFERAA